MPIVNRIAEFHAEMTEWRRDLHANPELGFEEHRTSQVVADKLASWGIDVHRGMAGTGVVGVLKAGDGPGRIGLRADMDALPILEQGNHAHRSQNDGKMHACGHDGHTTMLLGAAKYLAETRNFDGTVHFIFQPAEEGFGGGKKMVEEGLFEQFDCDTVWGMHKIPGIPVGEFAVAPGPMMAARDNFEITIQGRGAHAAMPHQGVDPVVVGAQMVMALQTITSRNMDPLESLVISVAQFQAGEAFNVIPDSIVLRGTCRVFSPEIQASLPDRLQRVVDGICAQVAETVAGDGKVELDFCHMLMNGGSSGPVPARTHGVHHPEYDFNDDLLPHGANYWPRGIVEKPAKTQLTGCDKAAGDLLRQSRRYRQACKGQEPRPNPPPPSATTQTCSPV